ncbi:MULTISPECIES: (2Fe-2S)-binding protein [Streptomyces]|uniref:(2Fe-2S)-binding protein n=1 Tax=Streptomyces cremeus TaxID=66881 RepID=A0ABV5PA26_STRCM
MPSDDPAFRREVARVMRGGWHLVDLVSALPEPGDSLMVTLFGDPILVVRERDEEVRAYRCLRRPRGAPQPIRCEVRYGNIFVNLEKADHQLYETEGAPRATPRSVARTASSRSAQRATAATPRSA